MLTKERIERMKDFETECKILHEVRVYDKEGKLKTVISEKELVKRSHKIEEWTPFKKLKGRLKC